MLYLGSAKDCDDVHYGLCSFRGFLITFISEFKFEIGTHIKAISMVVQDPILTYDLNEIEKRIDHIDIGSSFKKFLMAVVIHINSFNEIQNNLGDNRHGADQYDVVCTNCDKCSTGETLKQFFEDFFRRQEEKNDIGVY